MVDKYFSKLNWIYIVFGVGKTTNKSGGAKLLSKLWSLLIAIAISTGCFLSLENFEFNLKRNLEQISVINNVAVNVLVIIINIINRDKICNDIYEVINKTMDELQVCDRSCKLMAMKMFMWLSVPIISYIILVVMEIIETSPPFVLLTRIPTFLNILDLMIHLILLLASLKIINEMLSEMLMFNKKISHTIANSTENDKLKILKYLINHDIRFIEEDHQTAQVNVKFLCKVYDNLVSCIHLLEKYYGIQILLTIWLMFSSAVFGVTLISCKQAKYPWLVIASSILPFYWCYIGCYIEDQLQVEVGQTETQIIKCMIDYRCDQTVKNSLVTFKQLLSTNRLQFAACNLFHLNYSMLLGTIMNIITYSIILIQLFVNE